MWLYFEIQIRNQKNVLHKSSKILTISISLEVKLSKMPQTAYLTIIGHYKGTLTVNRAAGYKLKT